MANIGDSLLIESIFDPENLSSLDLGDAMRYLLDYVIAISLKLARERRAQCQNRRHSVFFWSALKALSENELRMDHIRDEEQGMLIYSDANLPLSGSLPCVTLPWSVAISQNFRAASPCDSFALIERAFEESKNNSDYSVPMVSLLHLVVAQEHPDMSVVKKIFADDKRCWNMIAGSIAIDDDSSAYSEVRKETILLAAKYTQSVELIEYLFSSTIIATSERRSARKLLSDAVKTAVRYNLNPYAIVEKLLSRQISSLYPIPQDDDSDFLLNLLHLAVQSARDLHLCQLLHSYDSSVIRKKDSHGKLPIHYIRDNVDVADFLVREYRPGAEVRSNEGYLPAYYASRSHAALPVLRTLLAAYPACLAECPSIIEDRPSFPELFPEFFRQSDEYGNLPLHYMLHKVSELKCTTVKKIIEANPNAVTVCNRLGMLPIHVLLSGYPQFGSELDNSTQVLKFLVHAYPDSVVICDSSGNTAYSCSRWQPLFVRRLILRARPDVNPIELRSLNYLARRQAMILGFLARPLFSTSSFGSERTGGLSIGDTSSSSSSSGNNVIGGDGREYAICGSHTVNNKRSSGGDGNGGMINNFGCEKNGAEKGPPLETSGVNEYAYTSLMLWRRLARDNLDAFRYMVSFL